MSTRDAAKLLRVSLGTIHNWEAGIVRVPYTAFKLMRLMRGGKVLGPDWRDFFVHGERLITPEGHEFNRADLAWWSLLIRQAVAWRQLAAGRHAGARLPDMSMIAAGPMPSTRRERRVSAVAPDMAHAITVPSVAAVCLAHPVAPRPAASQCGPEGSADSKQACAGTEDGMTDASIGPLDTARTPPRSRRKGAGGSLSLTPQYRPPSADSLSPPPPSVNARGPRNEPGSLSLAAKPLSPLVGGSPCASLRHLRDQHPLPWPLLA